MTVPVGTNRNGPIRSPTRAPVGRESYLSITWIMTRFGRGFRAIDERDLVRTIRRNRTMPHRERGPCNSANCANSATSVALGFRYAPYEPHPAQFGAFLPS